MPGLWRGAPGLGSGFSGLWRGLVGLWGGSSGGAPTNPDGIVLNDAVIQDTQAGSNPFTKVTVNVNGNLQATEQAATRTIAPWIAVPANAGLYSARMTLLSGAFDAASSPIGIFVACSGSPFWSILQTTVGSLTTVGKLEIRNTATGQIFAQANITQIATKNAVTGFEQSFNPSPFLVYGEESRFVTRVNDIVRLAVRGASGHTTGKWYVELLPIGTRLRFAGVVDDTFSVRGAGGDPGTNRCGIEGADLVAYHTIDPIGQFAAPGVIVRLAYDADADLFWLALGNGAWNGAPTADPETGVGGLSAAGLVGDGFVGVTLRPVIGAGVRYRLPGDPGYSLPPGYQEWSA